MIVVVFLFVKKNNPNKVQIFDTFLHSPLLVLLKTSFISKCFLIGEFVCVFIFLFPQTFATNNVFEKKKDSILFFFENNKSKKIALLLNNQINLKTLRKKRIRLTISQHISINVYKMCKVQYKKIT
ncbi:hypothetical protein RFI_22283 [Reticulomyxa filosa]|uniref:Uncharacterized protein n=1 Tax=Reticulomyxa filosa TaxID=46433 RepID=X6MN33_RETFI|nr:hypothetical protein RFI_22283 [Reticulomyxa filosa]|eukprot:ETO15081.1 hypothetical protein RFI_22283 [Reticulomyxa filosa]